MILGEEQRKDNAAPRLRTDVSINIALFARSGIFTDAEVRVRRWSQHLELLAGYLVLTISAVIFDFCGASTIEIAIYNHASNKLRNNYF